MKPLIVLKEAYSECLNQSVKALEPGAPKILKILP
jgi:hypothetical protein